MTAERLGAFAVLAWLCPTVLGVTLITTSVSATILPVGSALPLAIALVGGSVALLLCLVQRTSSWNLTRKLLAQIENLAAITREDLDPERFSAQIQRSGLSPRVGEIFQQIFQNIEQDRETIDGFQQKSTSSEVKVHLAETRAAQIHWVIDQLSEPVLMVNQYGEIMLINPSAKTLLGLKNVDAGSRVEQVVPCESLVQLLNETRRRKLKSTRIAEIELADPEGERHWYRVTVNTISDGEQQAPQDTGFGAVAVMRDISGYKAIQRRNAEFVSAVSHEMKTPLAGIKAYVELLADGEAEDEATRDEFLGVISGQADRLQRLIDNLLNLARIEAGVVSVSKKPRSLNEVLEEAASIVQPTAEQKNIRLVVELSPMYLGVLVDRDMILQAAINLLSNAVKYTPEEGSVILRSRLSDREVLFEVEDTGVGLSPEDCEMVFEKFYRVKKDQKMASGTGLGLPLAKHIVEDVHGGTLSVKSELGRGSTFVIALPTVQVIEHAS